MEEEELVERLEELMERHEELVGRLEELLRLQWERNAVRPTEKQVCEYARTCMGRTLREDAAMKMARKFIEYYGKLGWKNKKGEEMTNWERAVPSWVKNYEKKAGESIYEQSQTGGMNRKTSNNNQ